MNRLRAAIVKHFSEDISRTTNSLNAIIGALSGDSLSCLLVAS